MEHKAANTAWGAIFQAALEQLIPKEQRVIHDPTIFHLMPAYLRGLVNLCRIDFIRRTLLNLMERKVPGIRGGVLCRKRYIEEKLNAALKAGIQSVVVLGAGFDTLAYRVSDLASRQVYEVDFPEVMRSKEAALRRLYGQIPAHVKLVSTDFESQELEVVLTQAGYSGAEPAFFVWEGVTQYISEAAVRKVFEFFKKAPPGSQLVFTYARKDFIEGKQMYGLEVLYRLTRSGKELWQFGLAPDEVGAFLNPYAWEELEQVGSAEYQARYIAPANRALAVMEVERAVHAQKAAWSSEE